MKRFLLFLIFAIVCSGYAIAYDFSAVCESGQTLYYNITSSTEPYTVEVTYQRAGTTYDFTFYSTYPTGNLTIPSSVTYNNKTYSVTSIGIHAFCGCSGLTEVTIPNSVASIGERAFNGCVELTSVTIPNSVTSIGDAAFNSCSGLTEITFPYSVTSIGYAAFANCSGLASITIPSSLTSIGNYAFHSSSGLTSIIVEQDNSVYDSRDNCNAIIETSTNTLLMGCVNTIIPNSVTSIGAYAFRNFNGMSEITIPNSVTSIGLQAFAFCTGLTDIYVNPTTPPTVGNNCFVDVNATLWVPCGLVETYQAADRWNNFSDVRERLAYELNVSSANPQQGTAGITQQPNCSDGIAIITATPNDGYGFTGWNDGNTDNPRTIVVTTDTMFVATFTSLSNIETNINSEISIFPNPTNDKLNISSSETISEIEIVNAMGQVVKRMEINSDNAVCNVEDLTSGVYVVRFRAINSSKEATISQQKFIKE